jgi:predicted dienelactone hydrolase
MNYRQQIGRSIVSGAIAVLAHAPMVSAAENIHFKLGPIRISVPVQSLADFAVTGKEDDRLSKYIGKINPTQKQQLRYFLTLHLTPEQRSKLFSSFSLPSAKPGGYMTRLAESPSGSALLAEVGKILKSTDEKNGRDSLKTALIGGSMQPQGLSLLGFMQKFPKDLEIDGEALFQLMNGYDLVLKQENALIANMERETAGNRLDRTADRQLSAIDRSGSYPVAQRTIEINDKSRGRKFSTDLYWPEVAAGKPKSLPPIVISNGFGVRPDFVAFLARHLASYGFMVAVPDRIDSNHIRQRQFFTGEIPIDRDNFNFTDYAEFPRDLTYLLDELERRNQREFKNAIDTSRTGIIGYSFGAVAGLNLSGAKFDFTHLQQSCDRESKLLNLSLIYQCRALNLTDRRSIDYRDSRVKSLFLFIPMGYHLFGRKNLAEVNIPTFWQITDRDIFTPAIGEQLPSYQAISNPDKYLVIARKLGHTVELGQGYLDANKSKAAFEMYIKSFTTAFFKVHLEADSSYRSYLTPSYANQLTQPPYHLLVTPPPVNPSLNARQDR